MKTYFKLLKVILNNGAPRGIRTPDHLIRSQVLYPAELPVRYLRTNYSFEYKQEIFINYKIKVLVN